jgi:hypothetical protein
MKLSVYVESVNAAELRTRRIQSPLCTKKKRPQWHKFQEVTALPLFLGASVEVNLVRNG